MPANTLVVYHYFEKNGYQENLEHFLRHGLLPTIDYVIIVNGGTYKNLPFRNNVRYLFRQNVGYDFGGYDDVINSLDINRYDYFFFINCTVRGPFLPPDSTQPWTAPFINMITKDTKLVGTTINILHRSSPLALRFRERHPSFREPYAHVQSMMFAMDRDCIQVLKQREFFSQGNAKTWDHVIIDHEILMSQHVLANGWNISALAEGYRSLDYRTLADDINPSSRDGDPCFPGGYFHGSVDPLEIIFIKSNRGIVDLKEVACNALSFAHVDSTDALLEQITTAWSGHKNFAMWLASQKQDQLIVDLGVDYGYSTFCFALGCKNGRVYAIDSFEGDEHTGFRNTYQQVCETRHRLGLWNVNIVPGYFEEVAQTWNQDIDILHIDGRHGYKDVEQDYATWSKFVRPSGVVLLHDTCVPEFGVKRVFDEINLPKINFRHSFGLGVVSRNYGLIHEIAATFERLIEPETSTQAQREEAQSRHRLELEARAQEAQAQCDSLRRALTQSIAENSELKIALEAAKHQTIIKGEAIDRLKLRLDKQKTEIEPARRALSQVVAENSQFKTALEAAKHQTIIDGEEINRLKLELERQREDNRLLRSSHSWRVTAPFRFAHIALGRIVKYPRSPVLFARSRPQEAAPAANTERSESLVRWQEIRYQVSGFGVPGPTSGNRASGKCLIFVCHVRPFPSRAGNEYRIHRMLNWAEHSGYETILVIAPLGGEEPDEAALTALAGAYPNLVVVYRDGRIICRIRDSCDALAALNGKLCDQFATILGEPAVADDVLSAERIFAHDALIGVTKMLVDRLSPVAIIVNYIFMSRVFAVLPPKLIKIIDTHDVFSTKERKVKRYGIRDSLAISAQEEARLLKRADLIIAIQPDEELELKQLVPGKQVITVGVDFEVTTARNPIVPPMVLLVASANPMNKQAVNDFLEFAWPIIKKEVPDVVFRIAGSVGREIDVLDSQVEAVGHVDDLTRLYRAAKVVINPAIAGTGLKIKTIEALCHGCPVVVWPSGADGLPSEAKGLCDIVENWYLFARATIAHLNFSEVHPQASQARASVLSRLFSADRVYADLAATLQ